MAKSFGRIFWGLLLEMLDFRFNGMDVLPDFIGYLLIAMGCVGLSGVARQFLWAGCVAWGLLILSLINFTGNGPMVMFIAVLIMVMDGALIWMLLGGIMELAKARKRMDICKEADDRRIAYLILCGLLAATIAFSPRGGAGLWIMGLLLLFALILGYFLLHLIHTAKKELAR